MCVLGILIHVFGSLLPAGSFSEFFRNIIPGRGIRLCGYSCGIRSQIGNKTDRSLTFDIHAFIELLRDPHGLRCREIQRLGSLLLKRTGRERQRCLLGPLTMLYVSDLEFLMRKLFADRMRLFLGMDGHLFVSPEEMRRDRLFLSAYAEFRINRPVFRRNERRDLCLPVCNHAQRDRLHTPRRKTSLDFRPEERGDLVSYHTVENASRLLCVDKIHIDLARIF